MFKKIRLHQLNAAILVSLALMIPWGCANFSPIAKNDPEHISSATSTETPESPKNPRLVISIYDQKLGLLDGALVLKTFPVSTARAGAGELLDSGKTPRGRHEIVAKIGDGAPLGAVFDSLKPTGEVVEMNAPGVTGVSTRILRLAGLESRNLNTFDRLIYVHGTPAENRLGVADSGGCIRVSAREIIWLHDQVAIGTEVFIFEEPFEDALNLLNSRERRYATTLEQALAGHRSSVAQLCYEHAFGVNGTALRPLEALKWCTVGEQMGDPAATALLGMLHEEGKGAPKNIEVAKMYFGRAADLGNPHAHFRLAHLAYADVRGGASDANMFKHLFASAELGHSGARSWLASLPHP